MTFNTNVIERKAINVLGRLGSPYDASIDKLINQHSVEASKVQQLNKCSVSELLSGVQSIDLFTYLEVIGFDDALRQSILLCTVSISGISCLINYEQSINENTRLMYYSYVSKEEELIFESGKANHIVSLPITSTHATHMITKILWGFEFLCVISIPDYEDNDTIDQLLRRISSQLKEDRSDFFFTENEKYHLNQLNNVTVYGSETCIENSNIPLLTILTSLISWQTENNFHHPLKYTMHSLEYLYNNDQFPHIYHLTNQTNGDIEKISTVMMPIDNSIKDIKRLFEKIPDNVSNPALNSQWTYYKEEFCSLLDIFGTFQDSLRVILVRARRNFPKSIEIHQIISDQRYSSLETKLRAFYQKVYRWYREMDLIERLTNHEIQHINVSDIITNQHKCITITNIDTELQCFLSKEDKIVIMWYSSNQLKRIKSDKWEQIYERLIFERRQTKREISLVYVDFSQYQQILDDFIVKKLPVQSKSDHEHDPLRGKNQRERLCHFYLFVINHISFFLLHHVPSS